jgi:nucleotide-binding universal stress UspA family protein
MRDRLWIDPPPPRSARMAIPEWLQEVILRCLETDASRRYQSASLIAFDLRNPQQMVLTERGERRHRAGALAQAARWWRARTLGVLPGGGAKEEPGAAPVIMVAVDTMHPDDSRQPELQRVTRQILSLSPEFRLICVSVVGQGLGMPDPAAADVQVEHRIRLRHWIGPLAIEADRVSLHVLEAPDPAAALVEFAARNNVDLIVLGAPAPEERSFAWWRSVASSVTANAPCSVHVVRRSGEPAP